MDQPGTIDINPANRENENIPVSVRAREFDLARRGSAVPSCVSLLILHTKAESGAYSRDSSRVPRQAASSCCLKKNRNTSRPREPQQRAYELVREQHALTVARVNGRNSALSDALLRRPQYAAGGWVWIYNTTATIRQGCGKAPTTKFSKRNSR